MRILSPVLLAIIQYNTHLKVFFYIWYSVCYSKVELHQCKKSVIFTVNQWLFVVVYQDFLWNLKQMEGIKISNVKE